MPFSITLIKKAGWRARVPAAVSKMLKGISRAFSHDSLFPTIEEIIGGVKRVYKNVLPHQRKYLENKTPSGKPASSTLLSGGYGCITRDTLLYDPVDDTNLTVHQRYHERRSFFVAAIDADGKSVVGRASAPYIKGVDTACEVVTERGNTIKVSPEHEFLTRRGMTPLSKLRAGDEVLLASCEPLCPFDIGHEVAVALSKPKIDAIFPCKPPPTVYLDGQHLYWERIASITHGEPEAIYDIEVYRYGNYVAHGFVNSNSGKSLVAVVDLIYDARTMPGLLTVVIAPYDFFFEESFIPTFNLVLNFQEDTTYVKKYVARTKTIWFHNGSQIRMKAYSEADKIRGWEAHKLHWEELAEIGDGNPAKAKAIFDAGAGRLRAKRPDYPRRMTANMNPKGHDPAWAYWIKDSPDKHHPTITTTPPCKYAKFKTFGKYKLPDWATTQDRVGECSRTCKKICQQFPYGSTMSEYEMTTIGGEVRYCISVGSFINRHLPKDTLALWMGRYDPETLARVVMGSFDPIHSLIYAPPDYSRDWNVVPVENVLKYYELDETDDGWFPAWWKVDVGIDVGFTSSPWAVEYYIHSPDDQFIFCFYEIYEHRQKWDTISDLIKEGAEGYTNVSYWVDPKSARYEQGPERQMVEEEFRKRGIPVKIPRHYTKQGGVQHVRDLLRPNKAIQCPFIEDSINPDTMEWDVPMYEIGCARLYYLTDRGQLMTPKNQAEKDVFRFLKSTVRPPKESEEGLSPESSEKIMARDDHAQTAEMFALLHLDTREVRRRNTSLERAWNRHPRQRYEAHKRFQERRSGVRY